MSGILFFIFASCESLNKLIRAVTVYLWWINKRDRISHGWVSGTLNALSKHTVWWNREYSLSLLTGVGHFPRLPQSVKDIITLILSSTKCYSLPLVTLSLTAPNSIMTTVLSRNTGWGMNAVSSVSQKVKKGCYCVSILLSQMACLCVDALLSA